MEIKIYTDGACIGNPGPGGWAAIILEENEKMYSENNSNAIKHLSEEFNLSLRKQKDLEIKFNLESKKRELTSKALMSVSESEFLKKIIKKLNDQQIDSKKLISICKDRVKNIKDWDVFMKLFNDIKKKI